jgi:hypothetical protein
LSTGKILSIVGLRRNAGQAWWFAPIISALGRWRQEIMSLWPSLGYIVRLCLKTNILKGRSNHGEGIRNSYYRQLLEEVLLQRRTEEAGGVTQVIECLPIKCEAPEFKPQYHTHTHKKIWLNFSQFPLSPLLHEASMLPPPPPSLAWPV